MNIGHVSKRFHSALKSSLLLRRSLQGGLLRLNKKGFRVGQSNGVHCRSAVPNAANALQDLVPTWHRAIKQFGFSTPHFNGFQEVHLLNIKSPFISIPAEI
jgi:hypothetical protein